MLPLRSIALAVFMLGLGACQPAAVAPAGAEPAAASRPAPGVSSGSGAVAAPAEPAAAQATVEPAAAGLGEFRVVSVLLGNELDADNVVLADRAVFARKDAIHASVLSTGSNQGLRISARWLAPDGATIAETMQPVVPTSALATTFSLSNPRPWAAGKYQLLIAINGRPLQTRSFDIR